MSTPTTIPKESQDGRFWPLKRVKLDGTGHFEEIKLPRDLPRPVRVSSAFYQIHTGTFPVLKIGGLFNLVVQRPDGSMLNLVGGMLRHGAARWSHEPPIDVNDGDKILASYGGLVPRWVRIVKFFLRRTTSIQPDVQITWITEDRK